MKQKKNNLKGIPKYDGSGKGLRINKGRGGCIVTKKVGKGIQQEF